MHLDEAFASFGKWRSAVDACLRDIYCITIIDTGVDDELLASHWASRDTPSEFVEWFGTKYDLDRKDYVRL